MVDRNSFASNAAANLSSGGSSSSSNNDFLRLSNVISNNIQKIFTNVGQLESIQNQMSTRPDNMELKDKFHQIQHYTNQLARDTTKFLKNLSAIPASGLLSEQKQQKLQREKLTGDFAGILNKFQMLQRQEKNIEGEELKKKVASYQRDPFSTQDNFGGSASYHQQQQQQSVLQIDASEIDQEIMKEREDALVKLESDISDVNQIFKDLGMLVHEQGDVIDSIEANTESASANVEQGTEQLSQAQKYNTKARKKKFCLIGTLVIILAIIIIVLAATLSNKIFIIIIIPRRYVYCL
ncbi:hypothetical protein HELRODRAFT_95955 [Helobdella robusta]|uniref:t-SNARE coiled-coil homology domain-containing protein n=1 Tax=Helobdella robusta TaxID=6412 RepID=T1G990_HELRO|nr:hypothetical protein HELRODRAFT_95955 [Helobdella robusta]ESN92639.1 hypothetical protein HELRODRAFT_95955 [Helobdella robusta]